MELYLAIPLAPLFGTGVCGANLLKAFAREHTVWCDVQGEELMDQAIAAQINEHRKALHGDVTIPLIQIAGPELQQQTRFRGEPNVGYIFSEWSPITADQKANLRTFDVLVAGSEWNANLLRKTGLECAAVPQGVDRRVFNPKGRISPPEQFYIFSGGKWEYRKAQDLVIKAVKVLQQRHKDIALVAAWFNIWGDQSHYEAARQAGINFIGLPLMSQQSLATTMNQTDVGLFPNRIEGGTNLVMMEYLACGRPVIANVSTGQKDVLDPSYAIGIEGNDDEVVEQMIEGVERLYTNRNVMRDMGRAASRAMHAWSWERTAQGFINAIEKCHALPA